MLIKKGVSVSNKYIELTEQTSLTVKTVLAVLIILPVLTILIVQAILDLSQTDLIVPMVLLVLTKLTTVLT